LMLWPFSAPAEGFEPRLPGSAIEPLVPNKGRVADDNIDERARRTVGGEEVIAHRGVGNVMRNVIGHSTTLWALNRAALSSAFITRSRTVNWSTNAVNVSESDLFSALLTDTHHFHFSIKALDPVRLRLRIDERPESPSAVRTTNIRLALHKK